MRGGDFNCPSDLRAAVQSIERLVIVPTGDLQPAADSEVRHVIYICTVGARPNPNHELVDSHFATDQALINSGLAWTILRMSVYMDKEVL